eukprot:CAMPEP_0170547382 /NCGR_PEP_ID=MMETSP0211-20121228/5776_1 /TAXON_ID=311385 /ORGANISM="Pseudokeronopsis sp., Strain OXSARD2" /LENGTH=53 /DNA_ID=CAMNT_0010852397 /DNA_START=1072 /DNA_END=1233 /DNA_ORIENTATION=+
MVKSVSTEVEQYLKGRKRDKADYMVAIDNLSAKIGAYHDSQDQHKQFIETICT